jgi:hypothetical protein
MLKEQVQYLRDWVQRQVTVNDAYKQAFSELLPLVERIADTSTEDAVQKPKEKFSASETNTDERLKNWATAIRKAHKK